MKSIIMNWCLKKVQEGKSYTRDELEQIEYGLVSIYLTITKLIVIFALAIILGIFKEVIIFMVIYNIIRMPSFGLHASKSWICLLTSTIIFIGLPFLMLKIHLNIAIKCMIGIYGIILSIYKYKKDYKKIITTLLKALLYALVGILMCSVILLPTIYQFLNSTRSVETTNFYYDINYYKYNSLIKIQFYHEVYLNF